MKEGGGQEMALPGPPAHTPPPDGGLGAAQTPVKAQLQMWPEGGPLGLHARAFQPQEGPQTLVLKEPWLRINYRALLPRGWHH